MNDYAYSERSYHVRENDDDGRHRVTGRQAVVAVLVACILQSVVLACVCSYVHHELLTMNSQVRQVMHDCSCHHPVVSVDSRTHAVSPFQVNVTAGTQLSC